MTWAFEPGGAVGLTETAGAALTDSAAAYANNALATWCLSDPSGTLRATITSNTATAIQVAASTDLAPLFPVGERTAYQSMTFGWIVGEIVRRTDPKRRPFAQFVQDEISAPLGLSDLWLGIPDKAGPRVATLTDANAGDPPPPETSACQVFGPITPSTPSPCLLWKSLVAFSVLEPKFPSTARP